MTQQPASGALGPSPVRILIGADTYGPDVNGASYFTQRLAVGLSARGHEVHVACPAHPGHPRLEILDGVTVHRVPSVSALVHPTFRVCPPPLASRHAAKIIRRARPDVIHVQSHFPVSRALINRARTQGIPVVATNHFMPENLLAYARIPAWARRAAIAAAWRDFARVFNTVEHITTPTDIAAGLISRRGLAGSVQAISCGIDLARFQPRQHPARPPVLAGIPELPSVLFVGRLDQEKNLPELIDALAVIREATEVQLLIAGTGSQRARLAARARERGIEAHVHFLGFVPDEQLPALYAAADVFCMPGVAELQSLVTLEAMAAGLPVVAADAMALPHLVQPEANGYLYPPGDVAALAGYLSMLLGSPALLRAMGQTGREIASRHDVTASLQNFEAVYARALRRTSRLHPLESADVAA
jgi:glycosyltransferase involved in cell wall biosynthesis